MLAWITAQTMIPAIEHKSLLAIGIDLLIISSAACGFIVWYLDRGHQFQEEAAARRDAEHARHVTQVADVAYRVGFQDGGDEERKSSTLLHDLGNLVHLDMRRPVPPQPPPDWQPPDDHQAHGASWG